VILLGLFALLLVIHLGEFEGHDRVIDAILFVPAYAAHLISASKGILLFAAILLVYGVGWVGLTRLHERLVNEKAHRLISLLRVTVAIGLCWIVPSLLMNWVETVFPTAR
jgi:hypothetical protein